MMGWNTFLLIYGIASSIVVCVLGILYSYCGESEKIENIDGNSNMVTKTEVGIINLDSSQDFLSSEQPNCGGIVRLEWTILEITVIGMIGLAMIGGLIKGAFHVKNLIQKHLEKVCERKSTLELQLRNKIEREIADREAADSNPNQICRQNTAEPEQELDSRIFYP